MSTTNGTGHGSGDLPGELAADVVGRALHALEPDEESRVAEHLRECTVCRALLSETHATMAALAHALPPVEPPSTLRASILAAAAAAPVPPAPPARVTPPPTTRDLPAVAAPGPADEDPVRATSPLDASPDSRSRGVMRMGRLVSGR